MDRFSKEDLKELMRLTDGVRISLYMPTESVGNEKTQEPIRLKNLIRKASEMQPMSGLRTPQFRELIKPAEDLLDDALFWQYQSDGLVLFLSPEGMRYYRLPISFDELVVMADRYHIKPLFPLFTADGHFYILALSLGGVRFLECTHYSVDEVSLKRMPGSLTKSLHLHETGDEHSFRRKTRPASFKGDHAQAYHGSGESSNYHKPEILDFFRQVNDSVIEVLHDERAPLVLVGAEYLLPIYKSANTYSGLMEKGVARDVDDMSDDDLHVRSWEIVHPVFSQAREKAENIYHQLSGQKSSRVSDDVKQIVPAAREGRVDTLFVALDVQQWGWFDPDTSRIVVLEEPATGAEDLLDIAAVDTFLNSGNVYALKPGFMPNEFSASAIFRY